MDESQRKAKKQLKNYYLEKVSVLEGVLKVAQKEFAEFKTHFEGVSETLREN